MCGCKKLQSNIRGKYNSFKQSYSTKYFEIQNVPQNCVCLASIHKYKCFLSILCVAFSFLALAETKAEPRNEGKGERTKCAAKLF